MMAVNLLESHGEIHKDPAWNLILGVQAKVIRAIASIGRLLFSQTHLAIMVQVERGVIQQPARRIELTRRWIIRKLLRAEVNTVLAIVIPLAGRRVDIERRGAVEHIQNFQLDLEIHRLPAFAEEVLERDRTSKSHIGLEIIRLTISIDLTKLHTLEIHM